MFYVLAAYYARGRFLSAVRQSAPSGTSHRGVPRPGLRLLVTGSIHYTVKFASAAPQQRRKSKTVHAQRPDQIPPRAFYASPAVFPARPVIPAQAGTQRKTKHAIYPFRKPKRPAGCGDAGDAPRTPSSFPRRREPRENKARRQSPHPMCVTIPPKLSTKCVESDAWQTSRRSQWPKSPTTPH